MRALATSAAAIAILSLPCSLMAQEAAPNIAVTHAALANAGRPATSAPLASHPADPSATTMIPMMVLSDDVTALGTVDSHSGGGEWAGGAFYLAAMRGKSASAPTAAQSFEYRHFAIMAVEPGLVQTIAARDTLRFAATYAVELRRPAFVVSAHRNFRTDERAVALHWTRDGRFDVAGILFDTGPAKRLTSAERIADLAGGAPRAVRGWGLTASLYPSGESGRLSAGIDVRDQQDRDIEHRDARVEIFLRQKF